MRPHLTTTAILIAGLSLAGSTPAGRASAADKSASSDADADEGGIVHSPVAAQAIRVPVPLYAELDGDIGAKKVRVRYRIAGGSGEWSTIDMKPLAAGFAAQIPCIDVSETGKIEYYLQAVDIAGDVLASSGSRTKPYKIKIVEELSGSPPHLPGKGPPGDCSEAAMKRPKGKACSSDSDCGEGAQCTDEKCSGPEGSGGAGPAGGGEVHESWLGLSIEQDLLILGGNDVCTQKSQLDNGYSCFRGSGTQYHGTPILGAHDNISTGVGVATTRVLASFDRVLGERLTLGARLGFVLRGGAPLADGESAKTSLPVHAEIRGSWWFGDDPFTKVGMRPYAFVALGVAEVDAHFAAAVTEDRAYPPPVSQLDNPTNQKLDIYKAAGREFVGGGAGVVWATSPTRGFTGELKLMHLLPGSGNAVAPTLGYVIGL